MLNVKALRGNTDVRTAVTRLTDERLHEAKAASRRLCETPTLSLLAYLDFAIATYKSPEQLQALAGADAEYLARTCRRAAPSGNCRPPVAPPAANAGKPAEYLAVRVLPRAQPGEHGFRDWHEPVPAGARWIRGNLGSPPHRSRTLRLTSSPTRSPGA